MPHAHERMSERRTHERTAGERGGELTYRHTRAGRLWSFHQGPGMISAEPKPWKLAAALQKEKHLKHKVEHCLTLQSKQVLTCWVPFGSQRHCDTGEELMM